GDAAPGEGGGGTVPACRIEDWPDFAVRGVMLDVARDRVPTLATLTALVDRLASWKLNQLQLYMEHTYAYAGHEEVWRHADPLTADDLHRLDAHCRAAGVELVANQNTLGHFERWLRHDRYRPLAISPEGFAWVFGIHRPPLTLDPANPGALALVTDLLEQLVPQVGSTRVHVGMDEPWELRAERSPEWAAWLRSLRALPVLADRELLVWGDVLAAHPELLAGLPDGVTVCEWGYEDNHPFRERTARLAAAGVAFWVAPGTSSWLSLSGRVANMLGNVAAAAAAGRDDGATGLLVTDWGDMGHHQQPPVSDPGLATAAAHGWCGAAHAGLTPGELATLLDLHCYDDPAGETGRAVVALGATNAMVEPRPPNMSALALPLLLPQWPVGTALTEGLRSEDLDAVTATVDDAVAAVGRGRSRRPDAALLADEIVATGALLRLACHDAALRLAGDGTLASVTEDARRHLGDEVGAVMAEHLRLWLERFRPGGLTDSLAWFGHVAECYRTGRADPGWFGPSG
ncbi:MAG TPA: family 20 glycosylhydrolase, partial [Acidimicrobiales bacterium]|nr:family 20 glycosylhydrolase [Acidimicrobiales bacterium]